jgi:parallel beta-helix repeat protein
MNRVVFVSLTILCLLSVSSITGFIQAVKAGGGTIYIEPDGSIYPLGSPISSLDNVTYLLMSNTSSPIVILRNNTVFDGSGYEIVGSGSGYGINVTQRTNVTITDVEVTGFDYGIWLYESSNCTVTGNNLTGNNWEGITLYYSDKNVVSGNKATNDTDDSGIWVASSAFNTISLNQVSGNHIQGLYVDYNSHDNLFSENNITNNNGLPWTYGIYAGPSSYNNTFTGNNIANNPVGIYIHDLSSNNTIFHNNFIANTLHAYVEGNTPNIWDNGKEGNYWDNYTGHDSNHDGIGDTPYVIDANNTDHYPLMQPWVLYQGGTIYINADGSISPSTAPIYSADNITYTLTGNITANADGIVIERDNIVLEGAGYTMTGSGSPFIGNGTTLTGRSNVKIMNMAITNFVDGIYLVGSSNNNMSSNNVTANKGVGIVLETSSDNNTLLSNYIANNYDGIGFDSNSGNFLSGNNVTANTNYGILLNSSSNNVFNGNNITNSQYGIEFSASSNNLIFQNNFVNNTNQAHTEFSANTWDDGKWGNYWSDYLTKYPNATGDFIWNTPYVIDTNNTDHHPLMAQYVFVIPEFPSFLILPLMTMATLLAVIIYKKKGMKTRQS